MKKSIRLIFFFNSLLTYFQTSAQTCDTVPYQHIYYNQGYHETKLKNFSFTKTNDLYFAGSVNSSLTNINHDAWMMRTTFHGTPLWSKAIGTGADEIINGVNNTNDGGYIFIGNTKFNSTFETGWIGKVDSLGNPLWSIELKGFNGSLLQIEEMNNGDFIVVGMLYLKFDGDKYGNIISISNSSNFIMRINNAGKILWQRSFHHSGKEVLNKIQTLSDGNVLVMGNVVGTDSAYILKLNQSNGQMIWMNGYTTVNNNNYARIAENKDVSFKFRQGNKTFYLSADGKYQPNATQIMLSSNSVALKNVPVSDFGSYTGSEIYFANVKPNPVLFSVKNNANVQWAHIYNFGTSKGLALSSGRIYRNNIYLSGSYKANNISDDTTDESMAYLLKAADNGNTLCSDTFNIGFKVVNISGNQNVSYNWINDGAVSENYISIYVKNLMPVRMIDCSQQTCCNDVVMSRENELCNNKSFQLPDGTIAKAPGFYTSRMNTLTGCDSIIYTNLSAQKNIDLTLTKDTCLINNMPVTFYLPGDSSIKYRWQNGTTTNQFTAFTPGKYWVTAISSCNAIIDSVNVHDNCTPDVFIPSAFTPNNDGLNDVFRIPEINGQHLLNLNIYNRYGQLIFYTDNASDGWDGTINGTPQTTGTYIYITRYSDLAGKLHILKGTVSLIR